MEIGVSPSHGQKQSNYQTNKAWKLETVLIVECVRAYVRAACGAAVCPCSHSLTNSRTPSVEAESVRDENVG
jgi:hypothetical protein